MLLGLHDVRQQIGLGSGPQIAKAHMRFGSRWDDSISGMCDYVQSAGMVLQKEMVELYEGMTEKGMLTDTHIYIYTHD